VPACAPCVCVEPRKLPCLHQGSLLPGVSAATGAAASQASPAYKGKRQGDAVKDIHSGGTNMHPLRPFTEDKL